MRTIFSIFRDHVDQNSAKKAFIFLNDGEEEENTLTYAELYNEVTHLASIFLKKSLMGKPVLLLFKPGLEYIVSFLACQAAGVIAVPLHPPRSSKHAKRLEYIINDCKPSAILTSSDLKPKISHFFKNEIDLNKILEVYLCATLSVDLSFEEYQNILSTSFIQYTSGSTGDPKGVVITNKNLVANLNQIEGAMQQGKEAIIISWLPMYHDMGLIGNILYNVFLGATSVVFSPFHFAQKPIRWLKAISKYKGTYTGGPNFAYDLLNKLDFSAENLDLSSWEIAFNGSETVRYETITAFIQKFDKFNFNEKAMFPCYGLAESTLIVSGYDKSEGFRSIKTNNKDLLNGKIVEIKDGDKYLVSSGKIREGTIAVILKENGVICGEGEIGNIYLKGDSISLNYWQKHKKNSEKINDEDYLDTGDLGFVKEQYLYITGRKKEVFILNGQNYYPYDIERLVSGCHDALPTNGVAAFSVDQDDEEKLIIVTELKRTSIRNLNFEEVYTSINRSLQEEYGFLAYDIVLINPASLPRTSSGKIKRVGCKKKYVSNEIEAIDHLINYRDIYQENIKLDFSEDEIFDYLKSLIKTYSQIDIIAKDCISTLGLDSFFILKLHSSINSYFSIELNISELFMRIKS